MAVSENVVASTTPVTPKLDTYVMHGSSLTTALDAYPLNGGAASFCPTSTTSSTALPSAAYSCSKPTTTVSK